MGYWKLSLAIISFISFPISVHALPGDTLEQVIQWSSGNEIISTVKQNTRKLEPGEADYSSKINFEGNKISFSLYLNDNKFVQSEHLDHRRYDNENVTLEFSRDSHSGLKLLEALYGLDVVNDFKESRYVAKIEYIGAQDFYQGEKFAYMTLKTDRIRRFSVIPLNQLESMIKSRRQQSEGR